MFCRSDLLLLDEPTNHLDLESVEWLEGWITRYPHTLILISHDREFLDRTVKGILHIEQKEIHHYKGNYSDFERQRMERLSQQSALFQKQQREIEHLQNFIDRFRAKATKARQAQDRIKKLERMERVLPAHVDSPFQFRFLPVGRTPNPILKMESLSFTYLNAKSATISVERLVLRPGDRIGLLGRNGAGKTTLIKLMAGSLQPTEGSLFRHDQVKVGYFAQQQLDLLELDSTPYEHLFRVRSDAKEQEVLNFLGGFGFRGDRVNERIALFSGGEKSRLLLSMLVWSQPALLLLDEPTNHLDLDMRHALTLALQQFEGAVVLVSHDRFLLSTTVEEFYRVYQSGVKPFDGTLEEYIVLNSEENRRIRAEKEEAKEVERDGGREPSRREQRQEAAQRRKRAQPLRQKVSQIESRLAQAEKKLEKLEKQLGDQTLYDAENRERLVDLLAQQGALRQQIEEEEEGWLEAQSELEASLAGNG